MTYVDANIAWVPQVPGWSNLQPNGTIEELVAPPGAGFILRIDFASVITYWDYDENAPITTQMFICDEAFPGGTLRTLISSGTGISNSPNVTPLTQPIFPQWTYATNETVFYLPGNYGLAAGCLQATGAGTNSFGSACVCWSLASVDPSIQF